MLAKEVKQNNDQITEKPAFCVSGHKNLSASVFLFNKSAAISFSTKGHGKMHKFGRNIE